MSEFTASNGVTIRYTAGVDAVRLIGTSPRPSGGEWTDATASPWGTEALREFFRAEDDERLGRWRWPENPDYVVYHWSRPHSAGVVVLSETQAVPSRVLYVGCDPDNPTPEYRAARAYFDAHPEPKPWWDADVDEAWELTVNGDTGPFITKLMPAGTIHFVAGNGTELIVESSDITAGRRIYPEGTE